jgi:hypothetical protein
MSGILARMQGAGNIPEQCGRRLGLVRTIEMRIVKDKQLRLDLLDRQQGQLSLTDSQAHQTVAKLPLN